MAGRRNKMHKENKKQIVVAAYDGVEEVEVTGKQRMLCDRTGPDQETGFLRWGTTRCKEAIADKCLTLLFFFFSL